RVVDNVRSLGVALSACTVPHAGEPSFELGEDEIEIGIGIHGEPGRHRVAVESANWITDRLLDPVHADHGLVRGEKALRVVNGIAGMTISESYIDYGLARALQEEAGYELARTLAGNYITALATQACSLTVLRLDEELTELWDAPVHT